MALLSSCGQAHGEGVSGEEAPGVYSARFVTRFVACAYLSPVRLSHTHKNIERGRFRESRSRSVRMW